VHLLPVIVWRFRKCNVGMEWGMGRTWTEDEFPAELRDVALFTDERGVL
jgi:hypothetical protein